MTWVAHRNRIRQINGRAARTWPDDWVELRTLAIEAGVYRVGMSREDIIAALDAQPA